MSKNLAEALNFIRQYRYIPEYDPHKIEDLSTELRKLRLKYDTMSYENGGGLYAWEQLILENIWIKLTHEERVLFQHLVEFAERKSRVADFG